MLLNTFNTYCVNFWMELAINLFKKITEVSDLHLQLKMIVEYVFKQTLISINESLNKKYISDTHRFSILVIN
jgi:hypothetical protein